MAPRNELKPLRTRTYSWVPLGEPCFRNIYNMNYGDPNGPQEWGQAFKDSNLFLGAINRIIFWKVYDVNYGEPNASQE